MICISKLNDWNVARIQYHMHNELFTLLFKSRFLRLLTYFTECSIEWERALTLKWSSIDFHTRASIFTGVLHAGCITVVPRPARVTIAGIEVEVIHTCSIDAWVAGTFIDICERCNDICEWNAWVVIALHYFWTFILNL